MILFYAIKLNCNEINIIFGSTIQFSCIQTVIFSWIDRNNLFSTKYTAYLLKIINIIFQCCKKMAIYLCRFVHTALYNEIGERHLCFFSYRERRTYIYRKCIYIGAWAGHLACTWRYVRALDYMYSSGKRERESIFSVCIPRCIRI